jgi:hypothetical protein
MPRIPIVLALVATLMLVPTPLTYAQTAEGCQAGESPHFTFGFAMLKDQVGEAMGDPVTCEFSDPNGTGDVHQRTTTGLAFWRKSTNTPTFTDGFNHWGNTPQGWVTWTGASVDPPRANEYPAAVVQGFLNGCTRSDPNSSTLAEGCNCAIGRIQDTYTLSEFIDISEQYVQQGTFPQEFIDAAVSCF